ncbi:MAG: NTP transferase domain-containing protein, partial [Anaerolineales bacterium]
FVDTGVVCCGLSGLGQTLNSSSVYQAEQFSSISGIDPGKKVSVDGLVKVLSHPNGGLKHIPGNASSVLLLNQADTSSLLVKAGEIAARMTYHFDYVVISTLIHKHVFSTLEPTAAIILAAGSSSRFGQTKQLLRFNGGTFLQSIIDSAKIADLSPIVVVTGSDHEHVESSLRDQTQISVVYNPDWEEGQSTSIRVGLNELERSFDKKTGENKRGSFPGSVIFLLADQPQVQSTLLEALSDQHSRSLSAVIAPLVDGQRANPVLFDRITFPSLKSLKGDKGGRGIFAEFPPAYIPWYDNSMLIDVDTSSDYSKLLHETN